MHAWEGETGMLNGVPKSLPLPIMSTFFPPPGVMDGVSEQKCQKLTSQTHTAAFDAYTQLGSVMKGNE